MPYLYSVRRRRQLAALTVESAAKAIQDKDLSVQVAAPVAVKATAKPRRRKARAKKSDG